MGHVARDVRMRVLFSALCVKCHAHVYLLRSIHHIEGSYRGFFEISSHIEKKKGNSNLRKWLYCIVLLLFICLKIKIHTHKIFRLEENNF